MKHVVMHGDVLDILRSQPDNSFDALLSDPPYGLRFMAKRWDYDVPSVEVWREALRVLKPGAAMLSFGGSRTFHRVAVAIEDAGFELRDCLTWLYAKGFPKSLNVALKTPAWRGYGTALKPAWEPCLLARKPIEGTVAANIERWGVGALAIDACRVGTSKEVPGSLGSTTGLSGYGERPGRTGRQASDGGMNPNVGRWPANLCFDEEAAAYLDSLVGNRPSRPSVTRHGGGNHGGPVFEGRTAKARPDSGYAENGGPSRFFFCTKVSTKEREFGCEHLPLRSAADMTESPEDSARLDSPRTGAGRGAGARNHHPTLKPIALTKWLATMIKPPAGGRLLVPYAGAGSEMIGALQAGWGEVVGIEAEAEYAAIAMARIEAWVSRSQQTMFDEAG